MTPAQSDTHGAEEVPADFDPVPTALWYIALGAVLIASFIGAYFAGQDLGWWS